MKHIIRTGPPGNTRDGGGFPRFDGSEPNDARITRLLAVLASVAGDHTGDKLARQMIRNATADLFDAAARLERVGQCGSPLRLEGPAHV